MPTPAVFVLYPLSKWRNSWRRLREAVENEGFGFDVWGTEYGRLEEEFSDFLEAVEDFKSQHPEAPIVVAMPPRDISAIWIGRSTPKAWKFLETALILQGVALVKFEAEWSGHSPSFASIEVAEPMPELLERIRAGVEASQAALTTAKQQQHFNK